MTEKILETALCEINNGSGMYEEPFFRGGDFVGIEMDEDYFGISEMSWTKIMDEFWEYLCQIK